MRSTLLLLRTHMVAVRSYFSGSLCWPMLKGFTVNRSCSTCRARHTPCSAWHPSAAMRTVRRVGGGRGVGGLEGGAGGAAAPVPS